MTKKHFLLTLFTVISYAVFAQHILESPNKKIKVSINIGNTLSFSLNYRGDQVIKNANLNLVFNDQELYKSENPELITKQVSDLVNPLIPYKHSEIKNQYNELKFVFSNGFSVEFRAFNEGVVYRYVTTIDEEVEVNEKAELSFAGDLTTWLSQRKNFRGNYESTFDKGSLYHFPDTMQSYLPILMKDKRDNKILLLESDVVDYPHMYFKGSCSEKISALFPPFPLEVELKSDRASKVVKTADYIAKTNGNRSFPWRVENIRLQSCKTASMQTGLLRIIRNIPNR
ncbi:MAG: glycoside hydrolase family 97 N-terminal domain-containing protein [Bacteroidota bacterium]